MGLRESLNRNPAIITIATLAVLAVAIGLILYTVLGSKGAQLPKQAFFTTDDGKTWFKDDARKLPPFKASDGKEAVLAMVFSCNSGKDSFVAYMVRYTPEAQKQITETRAKVEANPNDPAVSGIVSALQQGEEAKKPGDANWVKMNQAQEFLKIITPTCPNGGKGTPEVVAP